MSDLSHTTSQEDLRAFAAQSEDMLTGAAPEDHTWVWVDTMPWAALGGHEAWRAFWDEAQREHDGHWEGLLDQAGEWGPATVALLAPEEPGTLAQPNVWDGNHRLGAAAILGLAPGPLVVGIPHGLSWDDVPEAWQQVPGLKQHFPRLPFIGRFRPR